MELSAAEVWSRILESARTVLPDQAYRTWLAPTEAVAISQDLLVVSTPNPFAVDWVEDKYSELLSAIGERLFGRRFTLSVQFHSGGRTPQMPPSISVASSTPTPAPTPATAVPEPQADQLPTSQLNAKYIFPRFVVGNNNQLAAAAAHAVAEAPARMYNPLFIYGGVGQGKTHLMHAIGNALLDQTPHKRVLYISSEQFTNELVSAIQEGRMADFRRQYRQIDLLLVDDVQFLEGKKQTQEEFFHTFNALHDAQRQIVLTSDRPPKDIGVEDRLISRFEWGLVADIQPPDLETRMAILQKKVAEDQLELPDPDGVLGYIARNCTSSVREIEGALIKLLAYASLTRREINVQLAREALGGVLRSDSPGDGVPGGTRSADAVRRRVAEAWGVTPEMLQSKKRTKDLTVPRQVAMYLIKEMLGSSLVEIGKAFGGRDHSTVIHSISKVEEDMAADPGFRRRVDEIRATLG